MPGRAFLDGVMRASFCCNALWFFQRLPVYTAHNLSLPHVYVTRTPLPPKQCREHAAALSARAALLQEELDRRQPTVSLAHPGDVLPAGTAPALAAAVRQRDDLRLVNISLRRRLEAILAGAVEPDGAAEPQKHEQTAGVVETKSARYIVWHAPRPGARGGESVTLTNLSISAWSSCRPSVCLSCDNCVFLIFWPCHANRTCRAGDLRVLVTVEQGPPALSGTPAATTSIAATTTVTTTTAALTTPTVATTFEAATMSAAAKSGAVDSVRELGCGTVLPGTSSPAAGPCTRQHGSGLEAAGPVCRLA